MFFNQQLSWVDRYFCANRWARVYFLHVFTFFALRSVARNTLSYHKVGIFEVGYYPDVTVCVHDEVRRDR